MNCVIPGVNMKLISKAVQALSKIGDELNLEAKQNHLLLRSVNMTTTAYCTFKFLDSFFSSYEIQTSTVSDDDTESALGCMIPMKAVLGVFKSHGHKEKKPEFCRIELDYNATKIIFKLKYKHDVVVKRSVYLSDGQIVNVSYSKDSASSQISANAQLFSQVLANFQMVDDDMGVEVTLNKALMRNYITGDTNKTKGIRSQLSLTVGEFNSFKIGQETVITYSLKPFRAAVHFAETFNLPVVLNFETSGRPAVLVIKNPMFEANFVIATLNTDHASQSTLASPAAVSKTKNRKSHTDKPNMTIQDQRALESVNWDNDMDVQPVTSKKTNNFSDIINSVRSSTNNNNNNVNAKNIINDAQPQLSNENNHKDDEDVIGGSPESPRSKRIKSIFGRCYETTFHATMMDLGNILAPDSDPDSE